MQQPATGRTRKKIFDELKFAPNPYVMQPVANRQVVPSAQQAAPARRPIFSTTVQQQQINGARVTTAAQIIDADGNGRPDFQRKVTEIIKPNGAPHLPSDIGLGNFQSPESVWLGSGMPLVQQPVRQEFVISAPLVQGQSERFTQQQINGARVTTAKQIIDADGDGNPDLKRSVTEIIKPNGATEIQVEEQFNAAANWKPKQFVRADGYNQLQESVLYDVPYTYYDNTGNLLNGVYTGHAHTGQTTADDVENFIAAAREQAHNIPGQYGFQVNYGAGVKAKPVVREAVFPKSEFLDEADMQQFVQQSRIFVQPNGTSQILKQSFKAYQPSDAILQPGMNLDASQGADSLKYTQSIPLGQQPQHFSGSVPLQFEVSEPLDEEQFNAPQQYQQPNLYEFHYTYEDEFGNTMLGMEEVSAIEGQEYLAQIRTFDTLRAKYNNVQPNETIGMVLKQRGGFVEPQWPAEQLPQFGGSADPISQIQFGPQLPGQSWYGSQFVPYIEGEYSGIGSSAFVPDPNNAGSAVFNNGHQSRLNLQPPINQMPQFPGSGMFEKRVAENGEVFAVLVDNNPVQKKIVYQSDDLKQPVYTKAGELVYAGAGTPQPTQFGGAGDNQFGGPFDIPY
ncbi:MAG: hypothetical protein KF874_11970 [Rhizobiaceae bacterium]|nr:hypothetical protein [Rhizobiaceae bacterium]